jgi:hypothetical protein
MRQLFSPIIGLLSAFIIAFLMAPVFPTRSSAEDAIRVDTLTFQSGAMTYRAEGIELVGVNLSPENTEILLHGSDAAQQSKALATLDATMIKISRLRQTQTMGDQSSTTIFNNVSLADVKQGIVSHFKAESATFGTLADAGGASSGSVGLIGIDDFDLGLVVGMGLPVKETKPEEFRRAYSHAEINSIIIQNPDIVTVSIERFTVDDAQVRDVGDGVATMAERMVKRQQNATGSDADLTASLLDLVDVLSSASIRSMEVSKVAIREPHSPTNFATIGTIQYKGGVDAEQSAFRIDNVETAIDDFHLKIGNFTHSGFRLTPVFQGVRKSLSKPGAKPSDLDPALFLPLVGRIELHDVTAEGDFDGTKRVGARNFVIALDIPKDAPPNGLETTFDDVYGPLPSDITDPTLQTLTSLGYRDLNVSGSLKLALDPKSQQLDIGSSLSAQNMANIAVSGRFGNISEDSLIASPSNAPITLLGAKLKEFKLAVENRGIAERLIDQQAIKTKRTADQVRASYASAAAASLQLYLGTTENAKGLTSSIVQFINNPNKLMISGQSKKPDGVGFADTAAGDGPAAILDLFELQREPQ